MKKTIKHIINEDNFLSLAGNLVIAVFGISGFAILARSYSLEVFGEWVLFITAGSFVEMFRFGITNTGLVRYLSGADETSRVKFIGSNALISLGMTTFIVAILYLINFIFYEKIQNSGYQLFFTWYPILAILNLPWNNALILLQADSKFGKILVLKSINSCCFFAVLIVNFIFFELTLTELIWALLIINAGTSILSIIAGWDGTKYIGRASRITNNKLLNFGKYTTFTLIGTNLLRSADTIIISLSPLGNEAVALFSIPLKLTELQQIPLRSFVATAFPKISKASIKRNLVEVKDLFYTYSGAISYLFVFISVVTFVFADLFVLVIAGKKFMQPDPLTGFNAADIVRVFSIYGLLLPIDRMTGITLDSINKPNINALKVFIMVIANILGDLIAVFVFKSLMLVAVSSIIFTAIGIWLGMYFLNKEVSLQYREIFISGIKFYRSIINKFKETELTNQLKAYPNCEK